MTGRDMDGAVGAPGRRFMLTACCCAMLADLYFTAVGGNLADGRSWIPLIPYILLCGALPFRPKTAGLLLIVYWWILVWLPTGSASDLLFSSCLVWGVLSFLLSPWMTLLAQSCNVLLLSLTVLRDTSEPRAVIAVLVMQIARPRSRDTRSEGTGLTIPRANSDSACGPPRSASRYWNATCVSPDVCTMT